MPHTILLGRIIPAVKMVFAGECAYRCERDLHHHLTAVFERQQSLNLGTSQAAVKYEQPTTSKYRWRRGGIRDKAGNVDMYFVPIAEEVGAAIELNYDYDNTTKIKQDLIKLIDPKNTFLTAVYIAVSPKKDFKIAVDLGLLNAFDSFRAIDPEFRLPAGLNIFVIEDVNWKRTLWTLTTEEPCTPSDAPWEKEEKPPVDEGQRTADEDLDNKTLLTEQEARSLLTRELAKTGIGIDTITAKCVFEATENSRGDKLCQLGPTPLWEHRLPKVDGRVLRYQFQALIKRLCVAGRTRQNARHKKRKN